MIKIHLQRFKIHVTNPFISKIQQGIYIANELLITINRVKFGHTKNVHVYIWHQPCPTNLSCTVYTCIDL